MLCCWEVPPFRRPRDRAIRVSCGSNPMSSNRSASSTTRYSIDPRDNFRSSENCKIRPGVPTRTSQDGSCCLWFLKSEPPVARHTLSETLLLPDLLFRGTTKDFSTVAVCAASSRVGEITSALGAPMLPPPLLCCCCERTRRWRSGRPNMIDFPLPVGDDAMISCPSRSKGMA